MVAELEKQRWNLDGGGEEKLFSGREEFGKSSNTLKQIVALAIWLGSIHFDAALALLALLFLPLSRALLVFCLLFIFMVLPLDEESNFGRRLSRYICKHAVSYFPVTLHVEDINAFDPNRSYGWDRIPTPLRNVKRDRNPLRRSHIAINRKKRAFTIFESDDGY